MPVVSVTLGKRQFQMACASGEEQRLHDLAAGVSARINELEGQVGAGNDVMLLAMTALMLQDELQDAASGKASPADTERHEHVMGSTLNAISDHLDDVIAKVEEG